MENWKDIKGYEGIYQISKIGMVKSLAGTGSGKRPHDSMMNTFGNGNGYAYVTLTKNKKRRNHYIHRLVAEAFVSNPESKPQVNHIDCNKKNNTWNNLEWVTPKENMRHAVENGRMNIDGVRKIDFADACLIRLKDKEGVSRVELCNEFDLSPAQISRIVNYKNWKTQ